jgi:SAM-dependent methyltransferase
MRRPELQAGAPRRQGGRGIWSTNDAMRYAERALALQAQRAYERTINDRQASKMGAGATPGRGSRGSSSEQVARQTTGPQSALDSSSPAPTGTGLSTSGSSSTTVGEGRTVSAVGNPLVDRDAFDAFEAAGWEEKAAAYERFFVVITGRLVEPLLAAASVGAGTRVLDVGTGPGWVAAQAAERGASVVGVDVAEAMIARARSAHPGLRFRWADAHELPFADASFDAVVGNLAVMHLSRPERAIAEFVRVLSPGGRLVLTAWADPLQHRLAGVFLDAVAQARARPPAELPPGPDFFRFSDDDEFTAALRQQGLASPSVTAITFVVRFASADELWNGMLDATVRVAALITRQPEEVRQRIRAAFDRLAEGYRRGEVLEMPVAVKLATAQKPHPG